MIKLHTIQERFVNYLRNADNAIAMDITGGDTATGARRLSIYYNAYRVRLRGSIEIDHPILCSYLGDEGFEQLAAAYIDTCPSSESSLRNFCNHLPGFLRESEPFVDIPVLADLASFERLLLEAFDAADAIAANSEFLTKIKADQWPDLTLKIHPSVKLFVTQWNCVEIWQSIKASRVPPDAERSENHAWLLWRNATLLTEFRSLPVDEYHLLNAAINGANFADLCESLLEWHEERNATTRAFLLLQTWIASGIIIRP